nr:MAG TPA: hypothetical protein [Caudoviricetes sp.]
MSGNGNAQRCKDMLRHSIALRSKGAEMHRAVKAMYRDARKCEGGATRCTAMIGEA